MNKLFKRTTAFVLMVCLLCAVMVPAVSAVKFEADENGTFTYDFELDQRDDLKWNGGQYSFGQTSFAHANANWVTSMDNFYRDGTINWSFPHTVHTKESAEAAGESNLKGKVYTSLTYKSHDKNPNKFGGVMYNNASNKAEFTGLQLAAASKGATGLDTGWNALILRAPDVGTYNVSLEYTMLPGASTGTKVFILPYTAEMKAQMASDPSAFNAALAAVVAEGTESANYMGTFSSWLSAGSEAQKGKIKDLGQLTVGINDEEFLMILGDAAGKGAYIQSLTLTPAEAEIPAEIVTRNYSITNTVASGTTTLNADGIAMLEEKYAAGDIDWSFISAGTGSATLDKSYIKQYSIGVYKSGVASSTYQAYKLRSPGNGTYDISFITSTGSTATQKSQVWTDVYVAEYTAGMDIEAVIADANYIGTHAPEKSDATAGVVTDAVGAFTFAADKEYVLVMKGSLTNPVTGESPAITWDKDFSADGVDCFTTNNIYMRGFVIEPQEAPITFVPKAYIGTTPYATVAAAAAAAQNGDTIKLAVDFAGNIDLPAGVSLDLNGNTWTVSSVVATNAAEAIIDSKGTGKLVTKSVELFGNNGNVLPLQTADNTYALATYELTVTENDYQAVGSKTRFWFNLELDDAYLDMIAAGNSGLTIGVELAWEGGDLAVTFGQNGDAAAFAAAWAVAKKGNDNVWLYVDITGVNALESDLTVKPVLTVGNTTLNNGTITYTVG